MGKNLIIKGADFSVNGIVDTPFSPLDYLMNGYIKSQYDTQNNNLVDNDSTAGCYVLFVYDKQNKVLLSGNASIYIPSGMYYRVCVSDNSGSANGQTQRKNNMTLSSGDTITKAQVYSQLGISEANYPYWAVVVGLSSSSPSTVPITPEDAITAGLNITFD